jgi:aspartyl-tRNA(Asn)/glutamyl-tRNA(Gln) amidotransferase subunit C
MISENDIEKLAELARLELDPGMKAVMTEQVNSILGYVERLSAVDTREVEAMSHTNSAINVLREDIARPSGSNPEPSALGDSGVPPQDMLTVDGMLTNAPDHSGTFIRVPLIVE